MGYTAAVLSCGTAQHNCGTVPKVCFVHRCKKRDSENKPLKHFYKQLKGIIKVCCCTHGWTCTEKIGFDFVHSRKLLLRFKAVPATNWNMVKISLKKCLKRTRLSSSSLAERMIQQCERLCSEPRQKGRSGQPRQSCREALPHWVLRFLVILYAFSLQLCLLTCLLILFLYFCIFYCLFAF